MTVNFDNSSRYIATMEDQITEHHPVTTGYSTALVTGATSGLGRAIAVRLAQDGIRVLVHGRDRDRGPAVVDEIEQAGGAAEFVVAELADPTAVGELAERAAMVDVLVNNGGFCVWGPTADLSAAAMDELTAVNVRAPFQLVGKIAPAMAARGRGAIVNITSMSASVGIAGGSACGAVMSALNAATRAWALEFAEAGVRVNAVAPGPVVTHPELRPFFDRLASGTLRQQPGEPHEVAATVAFLVSAGAANIIGAILPVDGGRTAV